MTARRTLILPLLVVLTAAVPLFGGPPSRGQRYATLSSRADDPAAPSIQEAYAKLAFFSRAGRAADATRERTVYRQRDDLMFDVRVLASGPASAVLSTPLEDLVTPAGGRRLDSAREARRYLDEEQHLAYHVTWREEPYAGSIIEDWRTPLGDVLARSGVRFPFDQYVSYEVTAQLDGYTKQYRALVLRDSSDGSMHFFDNIVGPELLEDAQAANAGPLYAHWDQYISERPSVSQHKPGEPRLRTNFGIAEICTDGFCCDNTVFGICEPTGCGFGDPFACGPLPSPSPRPINPGCLVNYVETQYPKTGFDVNATGHFSGNHQADSLLRGVCRNFANCSQRCQVFSDHFNVSDDGLRSMGHLLLTRFESVDGTNQCSANNTLGVWACLFNTFCSTSFTVGKKDVAGIEITAVSSIWQFSHGVAHTNCPAP